MSSDRQLVTPKHKYSPFDSFRSKLKLIDKRLSSVEKRKWPSTRRSTIGRVQVDVFSPPKSEAHTSTSHFTSPKPRKSRYFFSPAAVTDNTEMDVSNKESDASKEEDKQASDAEEVQFLSFTPPHSHTSMKKLVENFQYAIIRKDVKVLESHKAEGENPASEELTNEIPQETEELPDITPEMNEVITSAFIPEPENEILSHFKQQQVLRKDMVTLNNENCLNDEIINFYLTLIMERSKEPEMPSVYAFSSFFYTSLSTKGYPAVKRWTKTVDIFSYNFILVPLHIGEHWSLMVIDFREKKFKLYDSLDGDFDETTAFEFIWNYLSEECSDKKKEIFDVTGWTLDIKDDIPRQVNGYDCGMFILKYAEYITKNVPITFSQKNILYFRKKMVYDIMMKRIT